MDYISENNPWTVIMIDDCGFCELTLKYFESRNYKIIFNELDIPLNNLYVIVHVVEERDKRKILNYLAPLTNDCRTFPLIFRKKNFFGGYSTLMSTYADPIY